MAEGLKLECTSKCYKELLGKSCSTILPIYMHICPTPICELTCKALFYGSRDCGALIVLDNDS